MSTALQDAIRRTPPRTLTAQQPAGNTWVIDRLTNSDEQITINPRAIGLITYENAPFIASSVPMNIDVVIIDVDTEVATTREATVPPTPPRAEIIIDHTQFSEGGNFIIEIPELPVVSELGVPLGTIPAKSLLLSNVRA